MLKINAKRRLAMHQKYEEKHEITAMATVARSIEKKMLIEVNPDKNHKGNPYFKLYNAASKAKAKKVARISMKQVKYIKYKNIGKMAGKRNWVLDAGEKKDLMEFLRSPYEENPSITVWEQAILEYNKELDLFENETRENLLPNLKYPDFLPFNLPLPNYMSL